MGSIVLHYLKQLEGHLVNNENCLQWYYEILQITTKILQKYYGCTTAVLQVCRLQVTTCHYNDYSDYRFCGKVTWFADVVTARTSHSKEHLPV